MNLGLLELRRRPGRFTAVGLALTFVVTLLVILGGLLDGLILGTTGALRAQQADLVVFGAEARMSVLRSRITAEDRDLVADVDGVSALGGLGAVLLAAAVPGAKDLVDVAVLGYEIPVEGMPPDPPAAGTAYADRSLQGSGVKIGSELSVGPLGVPIEVVGWVSGTNYLGQGTLWVAPETWREVQNLSRPDLAVGDDVFQVLVVQSGGDPAEVAASIDTATEGRTTTLTTEAAAEAIPGVQAQKQVMNGLIGVTLVVAGLVAALFFALVLIERTPLLAGLKALGAPSSTLAAGIVTQALTVAVVACVLGGLLSVLITLVLPETIVVDLRPGRFLISVLLVLVSAVAGALVSLRRIVRIEPASALT